MKKEPLGYYNYTVVLTYIGMLVGFLGIVFAFDGKPAISLVCLMVSGTCDMFDGAIASTMKRTADEKCFGIQIDSLSDLICFGVLPAVIVYSMNSNNRLAYAISAVYVLAALIRLAYYNVDEQNRQRSTEAGRELFQGLPVTSIAILLPLCYVIQRTFGIRTNIICNVMLVIVGVCFLTPFKLKKPKVIGKIVMALIGVVQFALLIIGLGDV